MSEFKFPLFADLFFSGAFLSDPVHVNHYTTGKYMGLPLIGFCTGLITQNLPKQSRRRSWGGVDRNRRVKNTSPICIDIHTYCQQVAVFAEPLLTTGGALEQRVSMSPAHPPPSLRVSVLHRSASWLPMMLMLMSSPPASQHLSRTQQRRHFPPVPQID